MSTDTPSQLDVLEAESIHVFREIAAEFERPVLMYSVGKDSSVLVHLARKAFWPAPVPFPLLHVDTSYKFREMIEFRDTYIAEQGFELVVGRNDAALAEGMNPWDAGTSTCCGHLKTSALLEALGAGGYDAAIGGARRDEERSRAKERIYSFRDSRGQWDPKNQRPELWNLYNGHILAGESIRAFPLASWTELDVWRYIEREDIPVVPMYFAREREVFVHGDHLIPVEVADERLAASYGEPERVWCRFRTLGCWPCTGAVRSRATTIAEIIDELASARSSERMNRLIDHDEDGSMEKKKREGYF